MSRWFRHYAGMMRDEKLVRVAIKCGQPVERVLWIWGAILESAAEIDDAGRFDLDVAETAYFLRADPDEVSAILSGLTKAGRIARKKITNWSKRQFSSDRSRERVAAHRERQKAENKRKSANSRGDTVTLQERYRNSPDTETEEEIYSPPTPPQNGGAGEGSSDAVSGDEQLRPEHVVEAWNELAGRTGLNPIGKLTNGRLRKVEALIAGHDVETIGKALDQIEATPFLRNGDGGKWGGATFDWFTDETNFAKLSEGNYGQPAH